jgi:hypothetical protein
MPVRGVRPKSGLSAYFGSRAMAGPRSRLPVSATAKKIGIIGLDISHSEAFIRVLNTTADTIYNGYRVTATYPYGSKTIAGSYNRIPGYIEKVKSHNVAICSSIDELKLRLNMAVLFLAAAHCGIHLPLQSLKEDKDLEKYQAPLPFRAVL